MYSVGIIGLGAIAAGYGSPDETGPYVHAGGINQSEQVDLKGACDLMPEAIDRFKDKWGGCFNDCSYFTDPEEMLSTVKPDIVAICVKGPYHFPVLQTVIAAKPKAIFLEKPPLCSLAECDQIVAAAKAAGISITVSYSRHWGPHVLRMADLVREGLIGKVQQVTGYCGGAFLSFASHTTDMICQFAGYDPVRVFASGDVGQDEDGQKDGYEAEPSINNMIIEFASGISATQIGYKGPYGGFCVEVIGEKGCVVVPFYGVPTAVDADKNSIDLSGMDVPEWNSTSPFKHAYDQIATMLDGGPPADCTDATFHAVNEIGFAGIESVHTNSAIELPNKRRERVIWANG
ncbi:MAG: Gfo/Idh/MocA family oxidoreductase [Lentisphaeria bacterium]|nr:Gfo/Idh/MocA family oxidoreductase [Lentisphaeria bacterium]NQZ68764.1 Gfo/Idh/MocA family oxidoreductase [Lentisphaeria bacterium]